MVEAEAGLIGPGAESQGRPDTRPPEKIRESIRRRRRRIDATVRALERKLSPPEPLLQAWSGTRAVVRGAGAVIRELAPQRHKGLIAFAAAGMIGLAMRSRIARYGMAATALGLGIALARSRDTGVESAHTEEAISRLPASSQS